MQVRLALPACLTWPPLLHEAAKHCQVPLSVEEERLCEMGVQRCLSDHLYACKAGEKPAHVRNATAWS